MKITVAYVVVAKLPNSSKNYLDKRSACFWSGFVGDTVLIGFGEGRQLGVGAL